MNWVRQFAKLPYPAVDCANKTFIVVGSNTGMGKEAVRHFVALNASKVIMAVRSITKGDAAKSDIEASTKRVGVIDVWELDLSHYTSVKAFATKAATLPRIDAAILNASIATEKYEILEDNESTITVNVVSTVLLVLLLLPIMRASAAKWNIAPTITVVSSNIHWWTTFPEWRTPNSLATLNDKNRAVMSDRYPVSKLLQIFAVREIVARMASQQPGVILNNICPGLAKTELARNATGMKRLMVEGMKILFARSAEEASRILVHAATVGPDSHGLYFTNCDIKKQTLSSFVTGDEGQQAQKKFWGELVEKLEAIQPGITADPY